MSRIQTPNNNPTPLREMMSMKIKMIITYQAYTRRCTNVVLMLAHRLRRRHNIKTTLVQRLVLAAPG